MKQDFMPRVALLVETSHGYGRDLLRGIVRYARLHGPWSFYVTPGDFEQAVPKMRQWGGTGIIARITTPAAAKAIVALRLPTIALDLQEDQLHAPCPLAKMGEVSSDSLHAAQMAAEHLLERKFLHYAFVGVAGQVWSDRRERSFCERITAAGFRPYVYPFPKSKRRQAWDCEQAILAEWLRKLPKPVGLMACNDERGLQVLEACRAGGIDVPEEIAVVGVDNDELLCEVSDPPLSSVALNAEQGGYRAAALLDQMMRSRQRKPQRLSVEPLCVITRRSTDIVALDDGEVARSLRFIRDNAANSIDIHDVVKHVQLSRRALEMRFKKAVGRTIHAEIMRVRMEQAKRLLMESDLSIPKVASAAGFKTASYFVQVFRQEVGLTPARYRTKIRTGE